jgi:hypothetical protein
MACNRAKGGYDLARAIAVMAPHAVITPRATIEDLAALWREHVIPALNPPDPAPLKTEYYVAFPDGRMWRVSSSTGA